MGTTGSKTKKKQEAQPSKATPSPRKVERTKLLNGLDYVLIFLGLLGAIVDGGLMSGFALVMGSLFDKLMSFDSGTASQVAVYFAYLGVASFCCQVLQIGGLQTVADRFVFKLRVAFVHSLLKQDCAFFDEPKTAALAAQASESTAIITEALGEKLGQTFQFVSAFVVGLAVGFVYLPPLAGVIVAITPLIGASLILVIWAVQSSMKAETSSYKEADTVVQEALENVRVVSAYGLEDKFSEIYDEKLVKSSNEMIKQSTILGFGIAASATMYFLSFALAFWYGAVLIVNSRNDALQQYPLVPSPYCHVNGPLPYPCNATVPVSEDEVCNCPLCHCGCYAPGVDCVSGGDVVITFFAVIIGAFSIGQVSPAINTLIKSREAFNELNAVIVRRSLEEEDENAAVSSSSLAAASKMSSNVETKAPNGETQPGKNRESNTNTDPSPLPVPQNTIGDMESAIASAPSASVSGGKVKKGETQAADGGLILAKKDIDEDVHSWNLEFESVRFAYPNRLDKPVFEDLSFRIEAGKRTGIVGPSGCGKSTVFQLIERFYDVNAGRIVFGTKDIRHFPLQWYRRQIGYVSQEPLLFSGTVEDNIRLGLTEEEASIDDIERVCRIANAAQFIEESFPSGYQTVLGGSGNFSCSGGQKARIAIARALLRNPKLLLFDESTSSLDSINEREVSIALDAILGSSSTSSPSPKAIKATTVIVAHRLQSVRNCDKIVVLKDGVVAEQGTHDELAGKENGTYAALLKLSGAHRRDLIPSSNNNNQQHHPAHFFKSGSSTRMLESKRYSMPSFNKTDFEHMAKQELKKNSAGKQVKDGPKKPELSSFATFARVFNDFAKPDMWIMIGGILTCIISGGALPAFALLLSRFMNVFFLPDTEEILAQAQIYALWFVLLAVIQGGSSCIQSALFGLVNARISKRVRSVVFRHVLGMELSFFDEEENTLGILASKLASEASKLKGAVSDRFQVITMNTSAMTVGLVIAFIASWQLSLVTLCMFPLIMVSVFFRIFMLRRFAEQESRDQTNANGAVVEAIRGIKTIKSFTAEWAIEERFLKHIQAHNSARQRIVAGESVGAGLSLAAVFFSYALCFWYGSVLVSQGKVSFTDLNQALFGILMSARALGTSTVLAPDLSRGQIAANVIFRILDRASLIDPRKTDLGTTPKEQVKGHIEFSSVEFAFPTRPNAKVLTDLSFQVSDGSTVALVGKSGSGKTASLQLIERFFDPDEGRVLLDDADLKSLQLRFLREQISLVPQEPTLFDMSIMENIRFGSKNQAATDEECIEAATIAHVHEFVDSVGGYQVKCGRRGVFLSGGQKQRVAIARALVRKPKVLLGDELSSAMDEDLQAKVLDSLEGFQKSNGTTIFLVAHRLSTVAKADQIFVFDSGSIVESGSFTDLKDNEEGAFRALMNAQLGA